MTSSSWQPSAALSVIQARAKMLADIRHFFAQRQVLEVETPILAKYTVTEPHVASMQCADVAPGSSGYFLQTSPEYAMKRLLAAGVGACYQVARVFRYGEAGRRHNPEFTMLEWYRPGFDDRQLMAEMAALLQQLLPGRQVQQLSYRQAFQQVLGIDPHQASVETLAQLAEQRLSLQVSDMSRDDWLHLLISECVEPELGRDSICLLYDFPASQAALAKVVEDEQQQKVARRFEVFVDGLELANGYWELTDPEEQQQRFEADRLLRARMGKPLHASDVYLLAALRAGLPDCAGVALGLDRLLMLQQGAADIAEVLTFPLARA